MGSQHSLMLSSRALWGQTLVLDPWSLSSSLCCSFMGWEFGSEIRKKLQASSGWSPWTPAHTEIPRAAALPMQVLLQAAAGGCLSWRHERKSCGAAEWICLGHSPSQGNCVTILGQRFPLGDIRQYFKYPVCVPRAGPPPPRDKSGRGELMSCWLGMPRASRVTKRWQKVPKGDKGAAAAGRAGRAPLRCAVPAGAECLAKGTAHPPAGCRAGKAAGAAEAGREPRLPRLLRGCLRDASAAAAGAGGRGAEQPQSGLQPPG